MPTSTSDPHPLLLVLGMGYTASRFVQSHRNMFTRIAATARQPEKAKALSAGSIWGIPFDGGEPSSDLLRAAAAASHVLVSIPPRENGDPALSALGPLLRESENLRWIGYLSTTGIYGDHHGKWVDEDTPPEPRSDRTKARLEAEDGWRELATERRAVQVFRLSGIYGPGRNSLLDVRNGTAKRLAKPGQIFNRIHVDDIAAVLATAIRRPQAGPVFNLSDEEPAANEEVVAFAARLLGHDPPPLIAFADAELSDMARSFWLESKRVSSKRIGRELGVDLIYPTYREGLLKLLAEGEGQ